MKLQQLKTVRLPLAAALAAALLGTSVARAGTTSQQLVLSGFVDAADGAQLMAGDYADVIEKLAPHTIDFRMDEVAASTNLCVAYVASGKLGPAHDACNEAIAMARLMDRDTEMLERMTHQDALSVAYANRAVLSRLAGE